MSKLATALVCVTLALFFAGCSGSDSNMLVPNAQPTEADVTSVVQEVVLPLMGGTADLATEEQSASLGAPPPAADGQTCTDFSDVCQNGGTVERCSEGNHSVWSYSECELSSGIAHGSVTRDGGFIFGTTSFDIVVGELALDGAITWDWDGCIVRNYDSFSAVSPDQAVTIEGNIRCLLLDPAGELHLDVVSTEGTFSLDLDFDNGVGHAEVFTDEGSYICTIDMANGEADCNEI